MSAKLIDPTRDALYDYSDPTQKAINQAKPWKNDPHYFKNVRISAVALIKMVTHARSGGRLEVMGLMQGYTSGDTFVVTDAFRLPVEGTETRVNAQDEANTYLIDYLQKSRDAEQLENVVGWYHSHPGYGCWLSGIDVATQHTQQMFQEPFMAVVIDPDRTVSASKVEIGAFRTYPEGYKPETGSSNDVAIPLAKAEDFGAHADRYYSLDVSHFKSGLDGQLLEALWNKYWIGTLSSNPLLTNRDYGTQQIEDLAKKITQAETLAKAQGRGGPGPMHRHGWNGKDDQIEKVIKGTKKISAEEQAGLLAGQIKQSVFGGTS